MYHETKEKTGKERPNQILDIFECKAEQLQFNLIAVINPWKTFQKGNMI